MDVLSGILDRHFRVEHGELYMGGLPVSSLAVKFGTPAFVYDQGVLESQLELLRSTLPPAFAISYSVKANPTQEILKFFINHNCGLEIASAGELEQAQAAGCPPQRILFAGPGKTQKELEEALACDIGEIHIESQLELRRIQEICRQRSCQARVAVRVNPVAEAQGGAMRMGGKAAPFGIDEECLDPVVGEILSDPNLIFQGIHLFTGTQILDYRVLLAQYKKGLEIARGVATKFQCSIRTLDFGGGIGIPYFPGEAPIDHQAMRGDLARLWAQLANDPVLSETRFMVEPGRFLAGEAGVYVTRINDIKISRGKKFLILDGGMNHHLAASGNLGQTIKRNYPVAILNKISAPAMETVDVVGPLCTPLDVLARNVALPPAEVGDLFGVFQSGAYARSASPLGFLSHLSPPEIMVGNGSSLLMRERGQPKQYLFDQCGCEVVR